MMGRRDQRSIPTAIDNIAAVDPSRPWVSVPRNGSDLSQGFIDITYKDFANAIHHASFWLSSALASFTDCEVFAYEGPSDLRLPVITVAAAVVGKKILLSPPMVPAVAKRHLMDELKCGALFYATEFEAAVDEVMKDRSCVQRIAAPSVEDWLSETVAPRYDYDGTWETVKDVPWIIFHTSGTTGMPKPVVYTHQMMTSFDVFRRLFNEDEETQLGCQVGKRVYSMVPMSHFAGMTGALQATIFLQATLVLGPASNPRSPTTIVDVLRFGRVNGFVAPPFIIKELCRHEATLALVRSMDFVQWVGAPLDAGTADQICQHVKMCPAMGTTECGPYFIRICDDPADWAYYSFVDGQGIEFEGQGNGLFELVFRKRSEARWQQVFLLYPELEEYRTKDLFRRHPLKSDLWLYVGRTDDIIVISTGDNIDASSVEMKIMQHPSVKLALLGGNGTSRPFLIIESVDDSAVAADRDAFLSDIRAQVESVNETLPQYARLQPEFTIVAGGTKRLPKGSKDTVMRTQALALFEDEIDALYSAT